MEDAPCDLCSSPLPKKCTRSSQTPRFLVFGKVKVATFLEALSDAPQAARDRPSAPKARKAVPMGSQAPNAKPSTAARNEESRSFSFWSHCDAYTILGFHVPERLVCHMKNGVYSFADDAMLAGDSPHLLMGFPQKIF